MRCVICKNGETVSGHATVTLERDGNVVVIQNVPAEICENCGEEYVGAEVTARVLAVAEQALRQGVKVDVRQYLAA
jgi:YgiT-type zinc finger domain-containing protein